MKKSVLFAVGAGLLSLAACNSKADEAVEHNREAVADNIEAAADANDTAADQLSDNGQTAAAAVVQNTADNQHAAADNAEDHADDTTDSH